MRHGSLFSGIGGFDLAAEWMGWENVFHCEWNPFGQKVLKYYWPNAESFSDITKADFTKYEGQIDIITGGFPCQPYSSAGKRKGKEDERHLWPEMLRTIREVKPSFVVGENVRGLTNWNGGMVFDEVCSELEALGYQVAPIIIPASGLNAPHKRERIWFVAYSISSNERSSQYRSLRSEDETTNRKGSFTIHNALGSNGNQRPITNSNGSEQRDNTGENNRETKKVRRENQSDVSRELCSVGDVTNAKRVRRLQGSENIQPKQSNGQQFISISRKWDATDTKNIRREKTLENGKLERGRFRFGNKSHTWDSFPSQSPVCGGDDGLPTELDGITFSKWRAETIKGYGNAIVPQVALQIFKAIEKTIKQ